MVQRLRLQVLERVASRVINVIDVLHAVGEEHGRDMPMSEILLRTQARPRSLATCRQCKRGDPAQVLEVGLASDLTPAAAQIRG